MRGSKKEWAKENAKKIRKQGKVQRWKDKADDKKHGERFKGGKRKIERKSERK